jgi:hypothetical protein
VVVNGQHDYPTDESDREIRRQNLSAMVAARLRTDPLTVEQALDLAMWMLRTVASGYPFPTWEWHGFMVDMEHSRGEK